MVCLTGNKEFEYVCTEVKAVADKRDYYEVLGLSRDASDDEVKKRTGNWRANITQT